MIFVEIGFGYVVFQRFHGSAILELTEIAVGVTVDIKI
jgi:hypothetical protein